MKRRMLPAASTCARLAARTQTWPPPWRSSRYSSGSPGGCRPGFLFSRIRPRNTSRTRGWSSACIRAKNELQLEQLLLLGFAPAPRLVDVRKHVGEDDGERQGDGDAQRHVGVVALPGEEAGDRHHRRVEQVRRAPLEDEVEQQRRRVGPEDA